LHTPTLPGSAKPIAHDDPGVAEHTAEFHVTSILNKLGADTRARAAALAAQQGLV
jgi:DNA-binding NarL/FixJ family response regulator